MTILMITTHGYDESSRYGIDKSLFAVDRVLEQIDTDDAMVVTVQYRDNDGIYTQVYSELPWSSVRREIMDAAALFVEYPINIIVVFGSVISVQYGPLEDGWDWVEGDEDEEEESEVL